MVLTVTLRSEDVCMLSYTQLGVSDHLQSNSGSEPPQGPGARPRDGQEGPREKEGPRPWCPNTNHKVQAQQPSAMKTPLGDHSHFRLITAGSKALDFFCFLSIWSEHVVSFLFFT